MKIPRGNHVLAVCGFLLLAVLLVFGQTIRHEFVNFDDEMYVSKNRHVSPGLGVSGIVWAFTHSHAKNWHPLTSISLMVDCQFYGLNAGGHHLTNVLLHAAAAVLLFLVLRRMTGRVWPSALVAALFAVHPLRRIGGVGDGAKGRPQRAVFRVDAGCIRGLCAPSVFARTLPGRDGFPCPGALVQVDARDAAAGAFVVGLLAAGPVCGSSRPAQRPPMAMRGPLSAAQTSWKPYSGGSPFPGLW